MILGVESRAFKTALATFATFVVVAILSAGLAHGARNHASKAKSKVKAKAVAHRQVQRRIAAATSPTVRAEEPAERVLKVHGQSRNLSMSLVMRGEKDRIQFGDVLRKSYRNEILGTNY